MKTIIPYQVTEGEYTMDFNVVVNRQSISPALTSLLEECLAANVIQFDVTSIVKKEEPKKVKKGKNK